MRSRAEAAAAGALLALVLAACGTIEPTTTVSATPTASPSMTTVAASPSSTAAPSSTPAIALPEPGRPWDAATLLREMAASTRPDGVPAELQTQAVAEALAETIWTVDGSSWETFAIGGYCGTASCTLEIAGTVIGRTGEDLWVLEIDPDTAAVTVTDATVRSLPAELVTELDAMAREITDLPADAVLATARWLPPPDEAGRFALSYRSGGEEGSCSVELVLDATAGAIVEESRTGC